MLSLEQDVSRIFEDADRLTAFIEK